MAIRIRGTADTTEPLQDCRSKLGRLLDELDGHGLEPDEIWPLVNAMREDFDSFEARVKRELQTAA
jgi:hypothetical protein